jgi:murein L,D-transpeptidase YafK
MRSGASSLRDQEQARFPVHVFPFRMTDRNVGLRRADRWEGFWADLKKGYDLFEQSRVPPVVSVCKGRYVFEAGSLDRASQPAEERCPRKLPAVSETIRLRPREETVKDRSNAADADRKHEIRPSGRVGCTT